MYMLSPEQQSDIINRALFAFNRQFGVQRDASDMSISIDSPNVGYLCSIYISSKTDTFRIKLNLKSMEAVTTISAYTTRQLENYGPGMEDEVVVADLRLAKRDYMGFYSYLKSDKFRDEVVNDVDYIVDSDNVATLTEDGKVLILEDEV